MAFKVYVFGEADFTEKSDSVLCPNQVTVCASKAVQPTAHSREMWHSTEAAEMAEELLCVRGTAWKVGISHCLQYWSTLQLPLAGAVLGAQAENCTSAFLRCGFCMLAWAACRCIGVCLQSEDVGSWKGSLAIF